jgi:hypothetical protein
MPAMSLEEARKGVVARLRLRRAEIEEAIVARIRDVASDLARSNDVEYDEGQRAAVTAVLDYALAGIEHGEERTALIPSAAVAQVHRAARSGVTVDTVLRRYTTGYAELADFVAQEADGGGLLRDGTAFRSVLRTQLSLLNRLIATVSEEHAREVERLRRSSEQRRAEIVHKLLAGEPVDAGELAELGYELDALHLGVIVAAAYTNRSRLGRRIRVALSGRTMI